MDKYLLSRVVMPQANDKEYRDLFFRWGVVEAGGFQKALTVFKELHFNTWMNLFSAKKWYHYCDLGKLYLGVQIKGTFSIEIIGSKRNVAYIRLDEKLDYQEFVSDGEWIYIPVENAEEYDGIYFVLRYEKGSPCEIQAMGWYTDKAPRKENKLAIVTVTYKREHYINKTIAMFERYLNQNPELQERMHLFVIDNGQTLDRSQELKYTDIFYNINAGGAGGFGRGLMEVCKAEEEYTRCLFMDDDVEIIPESFYRTLVIADYLKEQFAGAHINGAMLDMYRRLTFYENLAVQDGLWCHPYHCEGDLLNYDEIMRVTKMPDDIFHDEHQKVNAPWYYCCFPVKKEKTINELPVPIFIRGDDVEWGWRNFGNVIISTNGICIWHAPFWYRVNKVTDGYYLSRNMFMVNVLYTPEFKQTFARLYKEKFNYAIAIYDYVQAKLINRALDDILKGSSLYDEDPEELMKELTAMAREETHDATNEYEMFDTVHKSYQARPLRRKINRLIRGAYRVVPYTKCLVKRPGMNTTCEWYPPVEAFQFKKHVKVFHLLKHTFTQRDFDYKQERELIRDFNRKLNEIQERYDELKNDYVSSFSRLTSCDFWERYLKLK